MSYHIVDLNKYYRKDAYLRFAKGPKCSISMTYKLDITKVVSRCREKGEKIHIALLYLIATAINSRDDYKMFYDFQKDEIRCYDVFNITHYIFSKETETCHTVNSFYLPDYPSFYKEVEEDIRKAKLPDFVPDPVEHPDFFNASAMPWVSYDSFSLELPDGYLYLNPMVNWGKFYQQDGKVLLPITFRMNHAIGDGYLLSKFFLILEDLIRVF
ncbi:MAG: CatA-like O-acetyltransferase [Bacilli bacterium]|jgi:chloramphenicol O-acetyltransferase type A|nr:CatA-like O-acetyltransferase [Bacilli bacterium]